MVVGSAGIFIAVVQVNDVCIMHAIIKVSTDVLQPRYGIGMCQAVALLLVPDI